MLYSENINKAMRIAYSAHAGQFDKSGVPYIFHPYHVAEMMTSEETVIVALLHDILEDTFITEGLLREYFSTDIVDAVVALTKSKDEDYFAYIERLKVNSLARQVKIADILHNMDSSRLREMSDKDSKRIEKYRKAIKMLLYIDS